jgi:hypothetical protein
VRVLECDLASLASVRAAAARLLAERVPIDILLCNAGIMMCPFGVSRDGYENHMAANHLGHFLLTVLLARAVAPASGRVVVVSSGLHMAARRRDVQAGALRPHPSPDGYNPTLAYAASKLANVLFVVGLQARARARRCAGGGDGNTGTHSLRAQARLAAAGTGITAIAVHPGLVQVCAGRTSSSPRLPCVCMYVCMYVFVRQCVRISVCVRGCLWYVSILCMILWVIPFPSVRVGAPFRGSAPARCDGCGVRVDRKGARGWRRHRDVGRARAVRPPRRLRRGLRRRGIVAPRARRCAR